MTWISGIFTAISALREIIKLSVQLWNTIREMRRAQQERQALDGNETGNTIDIEEGLGNPDAGKPSGEGQIREKKPK